ncbi:hypothetical protein DXG03_001558 [Asterophora parasitica]|uniref:Uncharacterized protein n=1 Tax=Asterophora parasitica TaxID=117018 RepID=A0A9P7G3B7_9AGAR|nr:hypothetical protein DXG03_001558 [Asterophora parasitica]
MIHRDVSFGNVVLNDELYADDEQCVRIRIKYKDGVERLSALIRRAFVDIGSDGGLHDLDMAAYIPSTLPQLEKTSYLVRRTYAKPEQSLSSNEVDKQKANNEKPRPDFRTGTTPFMSIPLLGGGQNSLYDDLQSIFFVHYLSLFMISERSTTPFLDVPNRPTFKFKWPAACIEWADPLGSSTMTMICGSKLHFFEMTRLWIETAMEESGPFWRGDDDGDTILKVSHQVILSAFHESLWNIVKGRYIYANEEAQPESVIASLNEAVEQYRKDLEV